MIRATFEQSDDRLTLKLQGHAGQAEHGKDLVCASCSILAYTLAQFVKEAERKGDLESTPEVRLEEGDAVISCEPSEDIWQAMFTMYAFAEIGIDLLAHNYPQYVELKPFGTAE